MVRNGLKMVKKRRLNMFWFDKKNGWSRAHANSEAPLVLKTIA